MKSQFFFQFCILKKNTIQTVLVSFLFVITNYSFSQINLPPYMIIKNGVLYNVTTQNGIIMTCHGITIFKDDMIKKQTLKLFPLNLTV